MAADQAQAEHALLHIEQMHCAVSEKGKLRGVQQRITSQRWYAYYNSAYLGSFSTKEEAALAHDIEAREQWGSDALCNYASKAAGAAAVRMAVTTTTCKRKQSPIQSEKENDDLLGSHEQLLRPAKKRLATGGTSSSAPSTSQQGAYGGACDA